MGHDGPPGRAGRNIHTYPFGFTKIRESMKIRSSTSTPNCSDAVFTITCISLRFNDCWTTRLSFRVLVCCRCCLLVLRSLLFDSDPLWVLLFVSMLRVDSRASVLVV